MNSLSDKIPLTNEQIDAAFDKLGYGTCIEMGDDENIVITSETLTDFLDARNNYSECGRINESKRTDYPALVIENAQLSKGQPRTTLCVIDFGAVRAVYSA